MIRAWLIALIREAVRMELARMELAPHQSAKPMFGDYEFERKQMAAPIDKVAHIELEPSFEQMQEQSIADQRKYYEPREA